MSETTPPWYVLTGGPCAGKTTTIDELAKRGYPVLAEAARLIIDENLAAGKTIEEIVSDQGWLQSVIARKAAMEQVVPKEETWFFDRGVPDSYAYYALHGLTPPQELHDTCARIRYRKVFLLDLVDFKNDEARSETPEAAEKLHKLIGKAYRDLGYETIAVPVLPVVERAEYILARL